MIVLQVDTHIQQLDQYLKKFDEELRRGTALPTFFVQLIICSVNLVNSLLYVI